MADVAVDKYNSKSVVKVVQDPQPDDFDISIDIKKKTTVSDSIKNYQMANQKAHIKHEFCVYLINKKIILGI